MLTSSSARRSYVAISAQRTNGAVSVGIQHGRRRGRHVAAGPKSRRPKVLAAAPAPTRQQRDEDNNTFSNEDVTVAVHTHSHTHAHAHAHTRTHGRHDGAHLSGQPSARTVRRRCPFATNDTPPICISPPPPPRPECGTRKSRRRPMAWPVSTQGRGVRAGP